MKRTGLTIQITPSCSVFLPDAQPEKKAPGREAGGLKGLSGPRRQLQFRPTGTCASAAKSRAGASRAG